MAMLLDSGFDVDKLSYEIFSILENKFLFGASSFVYDDAKPSKNLGLDPTQKGVGVSVRSVSSESKVRILSIDGAGPTNGILSAVSLQRLESRLRQKSGNPNACIADYFDVVAGSGTGGVLAALLFTRGKDGRPMFTADQALSFVVQNGRKLNPSPSSVLRRALGSPRKALEKLLKKTFGDFTLKDTLKSVLIPCYDLSSRGSFVFSRADALEMDGYDFRMSDVCLATSADPTVIGTVEMRSVDGKTKIMAVDGGLTMNNPTAAAITHVLNNKQEFPLCNGVENVLVVSLGNGESSFGVDSVDSSPARFLRIAGEETSGVVDQAVSMAFGPFRTSNYVRIQANGIIAKSHGVNLEKTIKLKSQKNILDIAEQMLSQKNVDSVLFQGKKMVENTNLETLELISGELMKEQERRKSSILPTVSLKQVFTSPRTSSSTTVSSSSSC
ncbi:hypothetical protein K2173_000349 [Erythroxylum novogranatense]|uniref:Patatin n=1 Tax=Erythroxylum novogranatense TaxID=1862640 RepID=A0AAV8SX91_9ROSI|nr:hypothetical protein K2173_000349 [Erythroxylum novogranatense]